MRWGTSFVAKLIVTSFVLIAIELG